MGASLPIEGRANRQKHSVRNAEEYKEQYDDIATTKLRKTTAGGAVKTTRKSLYGSTAKASKSNEEQQLGGGANILTVRRADMKNMTKSMRLLFVVALVAIAVCACILVTAMNPNGLDGGSSGAEFATSNALQTNGGLAITAADPTGMYYATDGVECHVSNAKAVLSGMGYIDANIHNDESFGFLQPYKASLKKITLHNKIILNSGSTALWFDGFSQLTTIEGLTNLDTSNVTNMTQMFQNCSSLKTLDLSNFTIGKDTTVTNMLNGCLALDTITSPITIPEGKIIDLPNQYWDGIGTLGNKLIANTIMIKHEGHEYNDDDRILIKPATYYEAGLEKVPCKICNYIDSRELPLLTDIYYALVPTNADKTTYTLYIGNADMKGQHGSDGVIYGNFPKGDGFVYDQTNRTANTPWYEYRNKITVVEFTGVVSPEDTSYWFYGLSDLTSFVGFENLDTSNVTKMAGMFQDCSSLTGITFGENFNTIKVTDMSEMFDNCSSLTEITFGANFNTSQVTDMGWMFRGCSSLTTLDVSSFNTSNVKMMMGTFAHCPALKTLDLSNWNTSQAFNMSYMFLNCSALETLDLSGSFDMGGLMMAPSSFTDVFAGCTALATIKTPSRINSNITVELPATYWDGSAFGNKLVANTTMTMHDAHKYTDDAGNKHNACLVCGYDEHIYYALVPNGDGTTYTLYIGNDEIMGDAYATAELRDSFKFDETFYNYSQDMRTPWYAQKDNITAVAFTSKVSPKSTSFWFDGLSKLTSINFENLDTSNLANMSYMFKGCSSLTTIDLSNLNTSNVTDMWSMFEGCSALTSLDVSGFNTSKVTNMHSMFKGCSKLTSLDMNHFDTSNVTSMYEMFSGCSKLTMLDLSKFNTSKVTDMGGMFYACGQLTALDLSGFNTSQVTSMSQMFSDCCSLTTLNLSSFNTSSVTNMSSMFNWCFALTALDLSHFDTSKVTNMSGMFDHCYALTTLDLSSFDTSQVTDMQHMFNQCTSLTTLDLRNFDTSNVVDMYSMFWECSALTTLNLRSFNTEKVTNIDYMFYGCSELTDLDLSSFNLSAVNAINDPYNYGGVFGGCAKLNTIKTPSAINSSITVDLPTTYWDGSGCEASDFVNTLVAKTVSETLTRHEAHNYIDAEGKEQNTCTICGDKKDIYWAIVETPQTAPKYTLYIGDKQIETTDTIKASGSFEFNRPFTASYDYMVHATVVDIPWFGNKDNITVVEFTGKVSPTNTRYWFYGLSELTEIKGIANLDTSQVKDMNHMFYKCSALTKLDVSNFDTSKVTNMMFMFSGCSALTKLDVSRFDTSQVTNMSNMFYKCSALTALDLSVFNTSNVTNMTQMFSGCSALTKLDVSDWDTSKVTNMLSMFSGCSALTTLDVSGWDTSKVTDMSSMFNKCKALSYLDVSVFNTSKVTDISFMFEGCDSLTTFDLSKWDTRNVANMKRMFEGCHALTILDVSNFNTSGVTDMRGIFRFCYKLTSLDLSKWDTSNVTVMGGQLFGMFEGCSSLTMLDLSGAFTMANVTNATDMFSGCSKLNTIQTPIAINDSITVDLPNGAKYWDVNGRADSTTLVANTTMVKHAEHNYIDAEGKEQNTCTICGYKKDIYWALVKNADGTTYTLYIGNDEIMGDAYATAELRDSFKFDETFEIVYDSTINDMVANTPWGTVEYRGEIKVAEFTSKVSPTSTSHWFLGLSELTSINFANLDTSNVTNMSSMFYDCSKLATLDLSSFNTSNVTNMYEMFENCSSLTMLDLSSFNTSNVTNMSSMFNGCSLLTSLDLSSFNTSNVTNMARMFSYCSSLTSLDMNHFDTSNVTDMSFMFNHCGSLTTLDLRKFNTSKVTTMNEIFSYCSKLTTLNLSGWDTSSVINMNMMFYGCGFLRSLDLRSFDTRSVADMSFMFGFCSSLTTLDLSSFDMTNVTNVREMLLGCDNLNTIIAPRVIPDEMSIDLPNSRNYWNTTDSNDNINHTAITTAEQGDTLVLHNACSGGVATCASKAICDICGQEYGEFDANNHDILQHHAQVPTCTEIGWKAYDTCSRCDYTTYEEIPATGHTFATEFTEDVAATCTSTGIKSKHCANCYAKTEITIIPIAEHTWNEGEVTTAPTCTTDGVKTYTCTSCGAKRTETILALDPGTLQTITPVGTINGNNIIVAGSTLAWFAKDDSVGRYQDGWWIGVYIVAPASITDANVGNVVYSNNGTDNLTKNFGELNDGKNADGRYQMGCWLPVKSEYMSSALTAGANLAWTYKFDWDGNGTVDQTFTMTVDPKNITLNKDGNIDTQTVDGEFVWKDGQHQMHTEETIPAVAPTCAESGLTEGTKCSVCGEILVAQQEIPALGFGELEEITSVGTVNGNNIGVAGSTLVWFAKDNSVGRYQDGWWIGVYIIAPSTITDANVGNVKYYTFGTEKSFGTNNDGKNADGRYQMGCWLPITSEYLAGALNAGANLEWTYEFDWDGNGTVDQTFTMTVDPKNITLNKDGNIDTQTVDGEFVWKDGQHQVHTEETITGKDATCTEKGLTEGTKCSVCGEILVAQQEIAPTGHTLETIESKAPTCTEKGLTTGTKCSVCGEILVAQQEISATGHAWGAWMVTATPTCTEDGSRERTCSTCSEKETETLSALGHNFATDFTVDVEPTCTEVGSKSKHCANCDEKTEVTEIPALGHSFAAEFAVDVEPTCTEVGSKSKHCANCDEKTEVTEIPALGHSFAAEFTVDVEPTCTEVGSKSKHCANCDATTDVTEIPALEHVYGAWTITTPVTCVSDGTKERTCLNCTHTESEAIASTGHTWGAWTVTAAPTCTEDGSRERTCSTCGEKETDTLSALGHNFATDFTVDVEPTCTEAGSKSKHCANCDEKTEVTAIPALGHTEEVLPAVAPTCEETGLTEGTKCSVCGEILEAQQEIPATGHTVETVEGKAPTCTETGLTDGTRCSVCDEILTAQTVVSPTGHTWDDGEVTTPATCATEGVKTYTCTVCGAKKTETISVLDHTLETIAGKDSTCTETGLTAGTKCSVCGEIIIAQTVIPTVSHTEVTIPAVAPTCTETGLKEGKKCSVCGEILKAQIVISPTGHTWNDGVVAMTPTCTTDGEKVYVCEDCGVATKTEKIPARGHITLETVAGRDATCTETGLTTGTKCAACGITLVEQEVIAAIGHNYVWTVTTAPTCDNTGVKTGVCSHDSSHTMSEELSALGHSWGEWVVVKEATVDHAGEAQRVCENDHSHVETKEIPALEIVGGGDNNDNSNYVWLCLFLVMAAVLLAENCYIMADMARRRKARRDKNKDQ